MGAMSQKVRQQGVVLLNTRINFYDGRKPTDLFDDYEYWRGRHPDWTVIRHKAKREIWARSTHGSAAKSHKVRYQLVATHVTGLVVKITLWECAQRCMSEIRVGPKPNRLRDRCRMCSHIGETS